MDEDIWRYIAISLMILVGKTGSCAGSVRTAECEGLGTALGAADASVRGFGAGSEPRRTPSRRELSHNISSSFVSHLLIYCPPIIPLSLTNPQESAHGRTEFFQDLLQARDASNRLAIRAVTFGYIGPCYARLCRMGKLTGSFIQSSDFIGTSSRPPTAMGMVRTL